MKNNVYNSTLLIEGATLEGVNPLPMFRNRNHHREVKENGSFTDTLKVNMGYETGERYLPYRIQDRYTRNRKEISIKTIVLENDILQAVFLPEYGGRLYSLKDKRTDEDILYKNPVFQPANLAILNAWFSGGIEWNIGQIGHTFTTCSSMHAAKLTDDEGNEFLRIYEYERCKNVFWHIDFHLPAGADKLGIYVRIINDNQMSVPMYWWTNIAVKETEKSRIFSSTSEVIYIDHKLPGFGVDHLPHLPSVPNTDVSYPMQFPFANEYFFQTSELTKSPWEAVAYENGNLFYERSTSLLRYRKMFCWGNHPGGRRWCDFLAKPGEGNYIEVQGGFAPTQLHGLDMPANTVWDFTQMIGQTKVNCEKADQTNWDEACSYVQSCVDEILSEDDVYDIHDKLQAFADKMPEVILHAGSGWGTLERMRRLTMEKRDVPEGFYFPETVLSDQYDWLVLLQEGHLPEHDVKDVPASWMIQDEWLEMLQESLKSKENQTWNAYMHLGVMYYERGMENEAIAAWERSLELKPSAWVYRNLAAVMKHRENYQLAQLFMEKSYHIHNEFPDRAFVEEYLNLLIQSESYEKAWEIYESLNENDANSDRIQIIVGAAALELGKDEFVNQLFTKEFAVIREGEVLIIELWYKYHARKLAHARNEALTDQLLEEAKAKFPPPTNIDFRILGS